MKRHPSPRARLRAAWLAAAVVACVRDVYRVGPIAPRPSPDAPAPAVRVLVFGDFGARTVPQWLVARAMRRESERKPFDLALQLGDNVYPCGPDPALAGAEACRFAADSASVPSGTPSPEDPAFRRNEAAIAGLRGRDGEPLPVFLALGNHDVGWGGGACAVPGLEPGEAARRRACLSVAHRTDTWTMPARHYAVDRGPLRIVVLDTNVAVADYGGFTLDGEIAFLHEALRGCGEERICFLAGHHPPAALHDYGRPGRVPAHRARLERLFGAAAGRARAIFAGHVHALEHLSLGDLEVFVSGSTAMGGFRGFTIRSPASARARFATAAWGYAVLEAHAGGYRVRFVDFEGKPLHCCEAGEAGPCRPVECRP